MREQRLIAKGVPTLRDIRLASSTRTEHIVASYHAAGRLVNASVAQGQAEAEALGAVIRKQEALARSLTHETANLVAATHRVEEGDGYLMDTPRPRR